MDKQGESVNRKVFTQLDRIRRDLDHAQRMLDGVEGLRWSGTSTGKKGK